MRTGLSYCGYWSTAWEQADVETCPTEIVRTLSVSRATVRKVIRSHRTEFKYERTVQPTPKLGV